VCPVSYVIIIRRKPIVCVCVCVCVCGKNKERNSIGNERIIIFIIRRKSDAFLCPAINSEMEKRINDCNDQPIYIKDFDKKRFNI